MRRFSNFLGFAAILVSITIISCNKDDNGDSSNIYNVSNPTEEILWLKNAIDRVKQDEYSYYVMATYKGETVFYYGNCNPLVNYVSVLQNCNGDNLGYTSDKQNELTNLKIVWKHENSKCNLQK